MLTSIRNKSQYGNVPNNYKMDHFDQHISMLMRVYKKYYKLVMMMTVVKFPIDFEYLTYRTIASFNNCATLLLGSFDFKGRPCYFTLFLIIKVFHFQLNILFFGPFLFTYYHHSFFFFRFLFTLFLRDSLADLHPVYRCNKYWT